MSIQISPRPYYFITCLSQKKLFECPVDTDLAKERAFSAAKYPFFFQILLRIRFFDIEVRFFGTAILKKRVSHFYHWM